MNNGTGANMKASISAFPNNKETGLTKREYFAARALQGLVADSSTDVPAGFRADPAQFVAKTAVKLADALLAEIDTK